MTGRRGSLEVLDASWEKKEDFGFSHLCFGILFPTILKGFDSELEIFW